PGDVLRGQGDDHVDHEVDRDDVQDRVGQARELLEHAAAIGHDQGVGDLVAVDTARVGGAHRGLDDRGAHAGDAVAVAGPPVSGAPLVLRPGYGVAVGPAAGLGAGAAAVDQPPVAPGAAGSFGGGAHGLGAHAAIARARRAHLGAQGLGPTGLGLDPLAGLLGRLVLGPPVDVVDQLALLAQPLGDTADVGGGHVAHVRVLPVVQQRPAA